VHLDGNVESVSGQCPSIEFRLDGRRVEADGSTDYKHGQCKDVSAGDHLKVDGIDYGAYVTASRIDIRKGHGHE
jgi:hypothetical protein